MLSIIVAMDKKGVIGGNNQMLWHLPIDLKRFKAFTTGKIIVMGHKTFQAIGKPLKNSLNIVISRNAKLSIPDCLVWNNPGDVITLSAYHHEEMVVIGGAEIYGELLPVAQTIYLTTVNTETEGKTYFPPYDKKSWEETNKQEYAADNLNPYSHTFQVFRRKKSQVA